MCYFERYSWFGTCALLWPAQCELLAVELLLLKPLFHHHRVLVSFMVRRKTRLELGGGSCPADGV